MLAHAFLGARRSLACWMLLSAVGSAFGQEPRQLTDLPGVENRPRYSPDGKRLAFDWVDGERQGISIVDLEEGSVSVVVERAGARSPSWAPDGRELAFTAPHAGRRAVWRVSADGGEPKLLHAPNRGRLVVGPDWSPDGNRIGFTMLTPNASSTIGYAGTIAVVGVDGTGERALTSGGDEWWPRWLPSGDSLIYYTGRVDDIVTVHAAGGALTSVSGKRYVGWRPTPSPDGKSLAMISATARQRLWVAPLASGVDDEPIVLTHLGDDEFPSWSPDGRTIAFSSDRSRASSWRIDLDSKEKRKIASDAQDPTPVGDGRYGYLSDADYPWQLAIRSRDRERIMDIGLRHIYRASWSPDGRWVVVTAAEDAPSGLNTTYLVNVSSGDARPVTDMVDSESVAWCDEGSTFVFATGDKRGTPYPFRHIFLADTDGAKPRLWLARDEHTEPTDCRDGGDRIAYRAWGPNSGLFEARREGGAWHVTLLSPEQQGGGQSIGEGGRWSPDGRRFAFVAPRNGQDDIFIRDAAGRVEKITDDALTESTPHWTTDGAALVFSTREPTRDIWEVTVPALPWSSPELSK